MADNIFVILKELVEKHPNREAVVSYDANLDRKALTFKKFWTLSAKCAAWLRDLGVSRHDNVLITVPMSLEYYVICFGIMMAGGAVVPMKKLSAHGRAVAETVRLCETAFVFLKSDGQDSTFDLFCPNINLHKETGIKVGSVSRADMPKLKTAILVQRETVIGVPYDTLCGQTRIMPDQWETGEHLSAQVKMVAAGKVVNAMMPPPDVSHVQDSIKDNAGPFMDTVIIGGGMMLAEPMERFKKFASKVFIAYMNSENVFVTLHQVDKSQKYENFDAGYAAYGVELKVLDKQHNPVACGQVGEIAVKSKVMFTRYYGDAELTRKAWTKDGWYLTSDAGFMRSDGRLFVLGRQGDIISRGVIIFTPTMIEKPISAHPDVLEVRVIPIPDPVNGQNSCACVVKRPESDLDPNDIKDLAEASMSETGRNLFTLDYVLIFENSIAGKSKEDLVSTACLHLGVVPPKV
ncbi:hypothetical protein EGW08_002900 [Elysia chlorotica]|uniref:AMP-dependent synthetase/ligase domain-containing protein n=1 Tax=Elysia chlorotica TaxID=188477 RepID=A0A3S1BUY0_ELYCH|nr:hypothetical protein EGW08_002900 [Elysia chlorotica]